MPTMIELKEVSKIYGFGAATTVALDEVSLNIERGEFVAIMGPSGSGKSTLLNMIGLLDKPTNGTYNLANKKIAKLRSNQLAKLRRDKIGFVFQSFSLLPKLNVLENVALPLSYKRIRTVRRIKRASTMLAQVGMQDREYFMPKQLSGGQSQRVAIVRALINNPSIIIADEPTGNLDSGSSRLVMELLSEIHKSGNTILMVTHNPELTRYASRVVYMHDGQIVHDEQTAIGDVPELARKVMYMFPRKTEDDDLAGVSALMHAIPAQQNEVSHPSGVNNKKSRSKRGKKSKKIRLTRVRR